MALLPDRKILPTNMEVAFAFNRPGFDAKDRADIPPALLAFAAQESASDLIGVPTLDRQRFPYDGQDSFQDFRVIAPTH
jgi:hypothetical protein